MSKNLKIAQVSCVYNEIDVLPYQIKYIKKEGLNPYVLDNYSTDGTWEWLQENEIPSFRFDTKGTFDLSENHRQMFNLCKKLEKEHNYDWVFLADADLFPVSEDITIREIIELTEQEGYNSIISEVYHFENKDEQNDNIFYEKYHQVSGGSQWLKIVKLKNLKGIFGDGCIVEPMKHLNKIYDNDVTLFNYGNIKSIKDREETYERRKKAWEQGLSKKYGRHYPIYADNNWKYKGATQDVRIKFSSKIDKLKETLK